MFNTCTPSVISPISMVAFVRKEEMLLQLNFAYKCRKVYQLRTMRTLPSIVFHLKRKIISQYQFKDPLPTATDVCGVQQAAKATNMMHKVFASLTELSFSVDALLETSLI